MALNPLWFWKNRYTPYTEQQILDNGGIPMLIEFRFVPSATLKSYQGLTTSFTMFGKNVTIKDVNAIKFEHEWMKDVDLDSSLPSNIDLWRGSMDLIIIDNLSPIWKWDNKYYKYSTKDIYANSGTPMKVSFRFVSGATIRGLFPNSVTSILGQKVLVLDGAFQQCQNEWLAEANLDNAGLGLLDKWKGSLNLLRIDNLTSVVLYNNKEIPFFIQQQTQAHDGSVIVLRTINDNKYGTPLKATFRFWTSTELTDFLSQEDPFTFLGQRVIWGTESVQYQHEWFGNDVDLNTTFSDSALDRWRGTINLTIA